MESLPQEYPTGEGVPRAPGRPECEELLPALAVAEAANDMRMAQLVRAIEQEIIPRLMLAHRASADAPVRTADKGRSLGPDEVRHFAKLVLSADEDAAFSAVLAYRADDVSIESIYLDLLAPTARYLGDLWTEDLCNFTDVTVGLGRLQRVLRELSPAFGLASDDSAENLSVLLLPSPGEQHTFGLVMVGEFFRRAGWEVSGGAWTTGADASTLVAGEWFDAVGFSLGAEIHLEALADSIQAVRLASSNPDVVVLVGGPLFGERPEYVQQVGADGMTIHGRDAPSLAERLIAESSTNRPARRVDVPPDPPHR
ncbi:MAG: cobalamin B12-binding domain-containing protein [Burkholderiales bacterium]|nr:cobalamin B12-binding domain-containing protein [Burkholderiales bacterium]